MTHYVFDILSVISALWLGLIIGSAWERRRYLRKVRSLVRQMAASPHT